MNFSSLARYYSLKNVSPILQDIFYVMLIPSVCVYGAFHKAVTLNVLITIFKENKRQKKSNFMYLYMLAFEIVDTAAGIFVAFVGVFECGHYCSVSYKYITKIFELIFYTYFTNAAFQFQSLLEISLAYDRYKSFSTKNNAVINEKKLLVKLILLLIFALIITVPNYILARAIVPIGILVTFANNKTNEEVLYLMTDIESTSQNSAWAYFLFAFDLIRGLFLHIVLFIINILVIFRYKAFLKNKQLRLANQTRTIPKVNNNNNNHIEEIRLDDIKEISNENHAHQQTNRIHINPVPVPVNNKEIKLTKMIISMNCNFLLGNLPISVIPILFRILGNSSIYNFYVITVNIIALATHMSYLIFYIKFNSLFRKTFYKIYLKQN